MDNDPPHVLPPRCLEPFFRLVQAVLVSAALALPAQATVVHGTDSRRVEQSESRLLVIQDASVTVAGTAVIERAVLRERARLSVSGGRVGLLSVSGQSQVTVNGGVVEHLRVAGSARVELADVSALSSLLLADQARVEVVARSLHFDGVRLVGLSADGRYFSVPATRVGGNLNASTVVRIAPYEQRAVSLLGYLAPLLLAVLAWYATRSRFSQHVLAALPGPFVSPLLRRCWRSFSATTGPATRSSAPYRAGRN